MDGILKTNYIIGIVLIVLFCSSCEEKVDPKEHFIKENFINIVDTTAYKYGSFRPLPPKSNDTIIDVYNQFDLSIKLNDTILFERFLEKEIDIFFNSNKELKINFKNLINNENYSDLILSSKFPSKIGRYNIFFKEIYQGKNIKYAGEVEISNFKISNNNAFLVVTKSFQKSMISYIVLFMKVNNHWKIIKREPLLVS